MGEWVIFAPLASTDGKTKHDHRKAINLTVAFDSQRIVIAALRLPPPLLQNQAKEISSLVTGCKLRQLNGAAETPGRWRIANSGPGPQHSEKGS